MLQDSIRKNEVRRQHETNSVSPIVTFHDTTKEAYRLEREAMLSHYMANNLIMSGYSLRSLVFMTHSVEADKDQLAYVLAMYNVRVF